MMAVGGYGAYRALFYTNGYWAEGYRGLPFAWYWYTDELVPGRPSELYWWRALCADLLIWTVVIIGLALLAGWLARASRRHPGREPAA